MKLPQCADLPRCRASATSIPPSDKSRASATKPAPSTATVDQRSACTVPACVSWSMASLPSLRLRAVTVPMAGSAFGAHHFIWYVVPRCVPKATKLAHERSKCGWREQVVSDGKRKEFAEHLSPMFFHRPDDGLDGSALPLLPSAHVEAGGSLHGYGDGRCCHPW